MEFRFFIQVLFHNNGKIANGLIKGINGLFLNFSTLHNDVGGFKNHHFFNLFPRKIYNGIYNWQSDILITPIKKQIVPEYSGFFFKHDGFFDGFFDIVENLPDYSG